MSKQDVNITPPKIISSGHPILRRNAKGTIPNFWLWYEWIGEAGQLYFPASFKELFAAPSPESESESIVRLPRDIPKIPLENENDDLLTDEQYAALAAMPDVQARALAQSRVVRELQMSIRAENAVKASTNEGRTQLLKQRMARHEAMILERPKLAAWVVSDLVMPAVIHDEIKADGLYLPGANGTVPAHVIVEIACRVLGGVSKNNLKQRMMLDEELRAVKQGNMPTHVYCTAFKRAHVKCLHAESKMDPAEVIGCFVYGLNLQIYELYIKAFNTDSSAVPATLGGVMAHALEYLRGAIEVNPSLSKVLDHSVKAFVAYSVEELGDDVGNPSSSLVSATALASSSSSLSSPPPTSSPSSPPSSVLKCQLCHKRFHDARGCFKLSQPEYIRKLVEAQPPREKLKGAQGGTNAGAQTQGSSTASAVEIEWPSDDSLVIC